MIMKVLMFRNPQSVDEKQLSRDLSLLPAWRRERVMEYRFLLDRVLCAKAYLLLKEGLLQEYGIAGNPEFSYGKNGKPFLRDYPDIHFNLSHCRKGILCVIDDREVGCDMEEIPASVDDALWECCHSEAEKRQIMAAPDPMAGFTKLWTMKEAYLKYTGEGISDALPELFSLTDLSGIRFQIHEEEKDVIYTLCSECFPLLQSGEGRSLMWKN